MHLVVSVRLQPIDHAQHVVRALTGIRIIEHQAVHGVQIVLSIRREHVLARGVRLRFANAPHIAREDPRLGLRANQVGQPRFAPQLVVSRAMGHVKQRALQTTGRPRIIRLIAQLADERKNTGLRLDRVRRGVGFGVTSPRRRSQDAVVRDFFARRKLKGVLQRAPQRRAGERRTARAESGGALAREGENGPRLHLADLSARGAAQRLIGFHGQRGFRPRLRAARHVVEPAIHRFAIRLGIAMVIRSDEEPDVLLRAEQPIKILQPAKGFLEPAHVEKILLLPHQNHRLRRHGRDEVRMVEAQGEHAAWALLGIGGIFIFQVTAERDDETARCSHGEARLHAAQPRGLRAPAGVARDADVPRIHFGPRQQVVEGTNPVPGEPRRQ